MLIVCPSCASRYELDGAKLGPDGRKVRCASCQTLWHVAPEPELPEVPSAEEMQALLNEELERAAAIAAEISAQASIQAAQGEGGEPSAEPAPRKRSGTRPSRKTSAKARQKPFRATVLATSLAVVGLVLLGGLVWQRTLASRVAPQLADVFEMLGYPINVHGLKLGAVESGLVEDATGRFLVVEGDVTNITSSQTRVPPIEVAVKDAAGQTLYTWKTDPPRQDIEPAELIRFRARLAAPPAEGQSVLVRFASSASAEPGTARR
ncbi:MAG: zinc-ribbon domain-containing protein [Bosea sp. (in: a-proteobacteria)]|uniref:zinc-ribbon domain-containing protein n=1 Tax=Bosea sp. (in: a-proteobacteria) TaxID=1871050 RepID=UPI002736AE73|nr:zinc-ribbon domain-containing protein [Bosea sp. (in: a-proteobacteria)]MDP3254972.1 zinc-ribbon domain-containing protein [Bosea sp. (in: a-proteobacteria)]MDP3318886.1 zinc-ribbon domain-containing protein [Bosea sp. (in: a-proteobacteria)]